MSRFPPIPPSEMQTDEQREAHAMLTDFADKAHAGQGFLYKSPTTSALYGIFAPALYYPPHFNRAFLDYGLSLGRLPGLSARARETAILTTVAHYGAAYAMYAHERKAWAKGGLSERQTQLVLAGKSPVGVDGKVSGSAGGGSGSKEEEEVEAEELQTAWEVARALASGKGPMGDLLWGRAVRVFGNEGAMALVQFVSFYMLVSGILNGFHVPVPVEANEETEGR